MPIKPPPVKDKIAALTVKDILSIPENEPERLFSEASIDIVKSEFRQLAKRWHPDRNGDVQATAVTQHLQKLYKEAEQKLATNTWQIPNLLTFTDVSGKSYRMKYQTRRPFELGEMYINTKFVAFSMAKAERELFDNAKDIISDLRYPDDTMAKKLKPCLPQLRGAYETSDQLIMVIEKDPDMILMQDVIQHSKGRIDPVHAAWMMSRLHNLSCYLNWAGLTHNAISSDTCFVSPKEHAIGLLGGWWYAAKEGSKLKAIPEKTIAVAPPTLFDNPQASGRLDLALIRATGREILGDPTGMNLIGNKEIPNLFSQWVNGASSGDPRKDYKIWSDEVLVKSFGARRFVEMKLSPSDIYQP